MRELPAAGWAEMADTQTTNGLIKIELDQKSIVRWDPKIQHERDIAIFDLLESNHFVLKAGPEGPYDLFLSLRDATLAFVLTPAEHPTEEPFEVSLPVRPLRQVIKDYFMICESYFDAIKGAPPSKIEAIDMARRGLHNEGSELLSEALADRVELDFDTARRLFTLICVLHLRG